MSRLSAYISGLLLLLLMVSFCSRKPQNDHNTLKGKPDTLTVTDAWVRSAAKGTNSAAYLTIINNTARSDTLKTISSGAVAMAEVHKSFKKDNMVGMRPVRDLVIEPGSHLELKPGGYHIMLMQVQHKLTAGDSLQLNLRFSVAGTKGLKFTVR